LSRTAPDSYLKDELLDNLGRMTFQLLSELWITRDRLAVVEQLLADKGVVGPREADDYTPTADVAERLEAMRKLMVDNVLSAPVRHDLSVADLADKGALMKRSEG
jgi:hypothetical protein